MATFPPSLTGFADTTKPILPASTMQPAPSINPAALQYLSPEQRSQLLGMGISVPEADPVDRFVQSLPEGVDRNDPTAILRAAGAGNPDLSQAIIRRYGIQGAGDMTFSAPNRASFGDFLLQGARIVAPAVGLGLGLSALFPGATAGAGGASAAGSIGASSATGGTAGAGVGVLAPTASTGGGLFGVGGGAYNAFLPAVTGGGALAPGAGVLAAGAGASGGGGVANFFSELLGGGSLSDRITTGIGLGADLYGQYQQGQAQEDALRAMRGATLGPLSFSGGGITATDAGFDLGPLAGLQQGTAGAASQQFGNINFASGIPPEIANALSSFQRFTNTVGGLPEQFLGSAGTLGQELGQGYAAVRGSTLDQLRASALPEQQRAVNSALSRLFATGSLGTTGGANVLGRLAEAQNQQDLGFQLAAGGESRAAAQSVADRFQALVGAGRGLGEFGADTAAQNLGFTRDMAVLPQALRSTQLSEVGNLLQLFSGLQGEGRNAFNSALDLATQRANAANAVAGNIGSFVGSPNYSASPLADMFGTIFSTQSQNRQMQRLFEQLSGGANA